VDAVDIQVGVQDCSTHIGHELNTKLSHFLVVVLDRLQDVQEMLWDDGVCHPRSLLEAIPVLDWHNARNDGDCYTSLSNGLDPADEEVYIKEHLGKNPGATEIDFCFQMFEFQLELLWGEEGVFWKTGNSDVEVVVIVFLDVSDEVDSMNEASLNGLPDLFPGWRVSPKCQNIATAVLFSSLDRENALAIKRRQDVVMTHRKSYVDLFGLHVGTRQMHTCLETNRPLAKLDHLCGEFGSTPARMPESA